MPGWTTELLTDLEKELAGSAATLQVPVMTCLLPVEKSKGRGPMGTFGIDDCLLEGVRPCLSFWPWYADGGTARCIEGLELREELLVEEASRAAAARSVRTGADAGTEFGSVPPCSPSVLTFATLDLVVAAGAFLLAPLPSPFPAAFGLKGMMTRSNHPFTSNAVDRVVQRLTP